MSLTNCEDLTTSAPPSSNSTMCESSLACLSKMAQVLSAMANEPVSTRRSIRCGSTIRDNKRIAMMVLHSGGQRVVLSKAPSSELYQIPEDWDGLSERVVVEPRKRTRSATSKQSDTVKGASRSKPTMARKSTNKITPIPKPRFLRLLSAVGKDINTLASELGMQKSKLETIMANEDDVVERWAPVLAKCTRIAKVGLLRILNKDYSKTNDSVGSTVREFLVAAGKRATENCVEALTTGWNGWIAYKLDRAQIEMFFAGECEEAERVADFLLKLANATDPTNIFSLFVR
eukprot:m.258196 g.258196  ORF g.258196 m.258196 type:complete len:289 (-) comp36261_c0_seq1:32-898(-)